jgi:hypothetical protein
VQKHEIDLGQPHPRHAALGGTLELEGREMRWPYLGGDKDIGPPDARRPERLAHLALVVVHFRGVNMAVSKPQRLLDDPRAQASAQLPGAQTHERNVRALCVHDLHHGSSS